MYNQVGLKGDEFGIRFSDGEVLGQSDLDEEGDQGKMFKGDYEEQLLDKDGSDKDGSIDESVSKYIIKDDQKNIRKPIKSPRTVPNNHRTSPYNLFDTQQTTF